MRAAGLVGASRRRDGPTTTRRNKDDRPAPDLVDRNFRASRPNQLWVADITYVPTWQGSSISPWCSMPGVARSSAGRWRTTCAPNWYWTRWRWRSANGDPKTSSTTATRGANIRRWRSANDAGEAGVRPSMGSVGDAYDNAMSESFFATLEAELLNRRRFGVRPKLKRACFSYIEGWYNPVRLHSGLGYRSPIAYEAEMRPPSPRRNPPSPQSLHQNGATSQCPVTSSSLWTRSCSSARLRSRSARSPPGQPINTRCRVALEREEGHPEQAATDVVEERGEPFLLPLPCDFSYAVQRKCHAFPVLRPARALLVRIPLGLRPSLHRLRRRSPGVVRRLHCYYGGG